MAVAEPPSDPSIVALPLPEPTVVPPVGDAPAAPTVAAETTPNERAGSALQRVRRGWLRRLAWQDVAAQGVFALCTIILLWHSLAGGAIRWQDDTKYFYFPLFSNLAMALREGRLPLWEPGLFGGFPLFSDGESGMLYPLHLVVLRVLDPETALVVLRCLRFYLAGAFFYAYLRSVRSGRTGAVVGATVFMLSGFMVGQIVHENLDSGMIWLALAMAFVERSFQALGRRRYLYGAFVGVALAMQALAVHVQVCVFTALLIVPYYLWRVLFRDTLSPRWRARLVRASLVGVVIALVGGGLAAVQLMPLLDLASRAARGHGIDLTASTINSVTPFRLLTVLFPHLLKRPDGAGFGYWVEWEVTIYVGLPALFLALAAFALRRDRFTFFFGPAAALSLVLSLGRYGPPWVVSFTQDLLGDHGLRSPGRFAFLWSFAIAVLAGLGADWLDRRAREARQGAADVSHEIDAVGPGWGAAATPLPASPRWGEESVPSVETAANSGVFRQGARADRGEESVPSVETHRRWHVSLWKARLHQGRALVVKALPAAVCLVLAGFAGGLLLTVRTARLWLLEHPAAAQRWLDAHYMAFDRTARLKVGTEEVYKDLLLALDPNNPYTRVWVVSLVAGYALLVAWLMAGQRVQGQLRTWPLGMLRGLTVVVVAFPLLAASMEAHPAESFGTIVPKSPAALYLRDQLAPVGLPKNERPLYRTYASEPVYLYRTDVEPNVLLPFGIQEAGGYSSLSTEPDAAYAWAAELSQSRMLDVWNVRYFLYPKQPEMLPSYRLTSFHPQRPLVDGAASNPGAFASFRVAPVQAVNVRLIATLRDAWAVPPGAVVATIVATDDQGQEYRLPVRNGKEVAEATTPLPAGFKAEDSGEVKPLSDAAQATQPLPSFEMTESGPDGKVYPIHFYYSELSLDGTRTIVRLRVEPVAVPAAPLALLKVYGLGLGMPDWDVQSVLWSDNERYSLVKEDADIYVYQNEQALPRAYLVPVAMPTWVEGQTKQMAEQGFDPERMVLIAGKPGSQLEGPTVTDWSRPVSPGDSSEGLVASQPSRSVTGDAHGAAQKALAERGQGAVTIDDPAGRRSTSPAGHTTVDVYRADQVRLTVDAKQDAWLFLADSYDPSWKAYVDGAPKPVHLADAIFRAVAVPAGHHVVEFRYEPRPLQLGALITLVTGLLVLAGTVTAVVLGRRAARFPGHMASG